MHIATKQKVSMSDENEIRLQALTDEKSRLESVVQELYDVVANLANDLATKDELNRELYDVVANLADDLATKDELNRVLREDLRNCEFQLGVSQQSFKAMLENVNYNNMHS